MKIALISATCAALLAAPALAQNFTTAAEVKPILEMTKANWVAVREYDGRDLVYFTQILSWRCGVESVAYSVNGGAMTLLDMEPCYEGESAPNAQKPDAAELGYLRLPLGSVQSISVTLSFADGTTLSESFARGAVQIQ